MYSTAYLQTALFCAALFGDGFEIPGLGFIYSVRMIFVLILNLCRLQVGHG